MILPRDGLLITPLFWACFLTYALLERSISGAIPRALHYGLTALFSAVFVWVFTGIGGIYLVLLYAALTAIFASAKLAASGETGSVGIWWVLAVVVGLWALGKIGASLQLSPFRWLFFLGVSFLVVKVWTFCKDLRDGRIRDPDLPSFLAYCTFFPCFVSGPMHYYSEFREAFEKRDELDASILVDCAFRILHGLVKVLIVAQLLHPYSLEGIRDVGLSQVSPPALVARSVIYSFVIYLDFSGYSDIAIAGSRLLGIRVPENFRMPYAARNLRDFWQRWHITFTRFLTQYLFVPTARLLQKRGAWAQSALTSTAYLLTFAFCGFWHGSTANFLAWGVYHGAGLSAYDWFRQRQLAAARLSRTPIKTPGTLLRVVFTAMTFLFVSLGWIFFILPLGFWTR
jgi:alginate O-acetyltransferase complex protein AlgI